MTTIVYDHRARQIAIDGRTTSGGMINTEDAVKWIQDGDDWWFICGSVCDRRRLIEHINATDPDAPKWKIECSAFLVRAGKVYHCMVTDDGEPAKSEINYSDSMGSGSQFALSALDLGKSAEDAVKYAATRDTGTGPNVWVFDVEALAFLAKAA